MNNVLSFDFNRWDISCSLFLKYAGDLGYYNIIPSDIDKYQGIVSFINRRVGEIIFQGWDGIFIEFDKDVKSIIFYANDSKAKELFTYKENIPDAISVEDLKKENEHLRAQLERFKSMSDIKFVPWDKTHRPTLGTEIVYGDGSYLITSVRGIADCNLLIIGMGTMEMRSDDVLLYCRQVNGEMCGYIESKEVSN